MDIIFSPDVLFARMCPRNLEN